MPAPLNTEELLDLVRKSELIPAPRLEAFLQQLRAAESAVTPRHLADYLVAAGLVTQFQADQLLQGKWRGFTIGKYRVMERLGIGGMGSVYLCEHMVVGRRVAIKVLPTNQADNPSALGRFYREARASGVLDHPNLVKAHDIDQDGPLHFLVMDYIDGINLQDLVSKVGPLEPERAAHYVSMAARGLHAAYEGGLVHRDVKPANVIVERNGNVRVLDLGLARFFNDHSDPLTLKYDEKNVLGTADYVAPEQALNSHDVDIRADIYSLGGTFYFLLTGQPPFVGGKVAQKLMWHQVRQPESILELRPEVPRALVSVVNRMMAKHPGQRYQTPGEVVEALAPWTKTPIAPPADEELPQLSPAASPSCMTPIPPKGYGSRATVPATKPGSAVSLPAVAVETSPSGTGQATPRLLASHTDTGTDRPVARSGHAKAPAATWAGASRAAAARKRALPFWGQQGFFLALVVLAGAVFGLGLGWLFGRF